MSGLYGFCFDDGYIPIRKNEYEELIRDSALLETITREALNNSLFSREDFLRMVGYVTEEKGTMIKNAIRGMSLR